MKHTSLRYLHDGDVWGHGFDPHCWSHAGGCNLCISNVRSLAYGTYFKLLRYQDRRRIWVYGGSQLLRKSRSGGVDILIMKLAVCHQRRPHPNNHQLSISIGDKGVRIWYHHEPSTLASSQDSEPSTQRYLKWFLIWSVPGDAQFPGRWSIMIMNLSMSSTSNCLVANACKLSVIVDSDDHLHRIKALFSARLWNEVICHQQTPLARDPIFWIASSRMTPNQREDN